MDYNKVNNIDIDGNGNITLQDVKGENITVNYNDTAEFSKLLSLSNDKLLVEIQRLILEQKNTNQNFESILKKYLDLPPEVKEEKEKIAAKLNELSNSLAQWQTDSQNTNTTSEQDYENEFFDEEEWEFLIDAIRDGGCVLFIGQEISTDENGKSLHEAFFKKLEKQFSVEYMANEGFFAPIDNDMIKYKVKKFYRESFHEKNSKGYKLLSKLAQIPFSLILSLTPDNTMHRIYENFDKKHQYHHYQKNTKPEIEKLSSENPLVYNILGEAEKYQYIFTHEQFYDYIRKIELSPEVKDKLQDATHFLFFGFDFNKWYNRLILFFLESSERKNKPFAHAIDKNVIQPEFKNFIKNQFNITYINNNYSEFINQLLQKTKAENLNLNLYENFVKQKQSKIQVFNSQVIDINSQEKLLQLAKEIEQFENEIKIFKNI